MAEGERIIYVPQGSIPMTFAQILTPLENTSGNFVLCQSDDIGALVSPVKPYASPDPPRPPPPPPSTTSASAPAKPTVSSSSGRRKPSSQAGVGRGPISDESRELRFVNEIKTDQVKCLFCNQMLPKAYVAIQEHLDNFHKQPSTKMDVDETQNGNGS